MEAVVVTSRVAMEVVVVILDNSRVVILVVHQEDTVVEHQVDMQHRLAWAVVVVMANNHRRAFPASHRKHNVYLPWLTKIVRGKSHTPN